MLRDRGTLTARIGSGARRKDLVPFASDLEKMRVVPFSGIHVDLCHSHPRTCQPACDTSYNVILYRLQIKTLSLDFGLDWDQCAEK